MSKKWWYIEEKRAICEGKAVRIGKKGAGDRNPGVIIQGAFLRDKTTAFLTIGETVFASRSASEAQGRIVHTKGIGQDSFLIRPDKGSRIDW